MINYIAYYLATGFLFALHEAIFYSGIREDFNIYTVPKLLRGFLLRVVGWPWFLVRGVK